MSRHLAPSIFRFSSSQIDPLTAPVIQRIAGKWQLSLLLPNRLTYMQSHAGGLGGVMADTDSDTPR